VLVGTRLVFIHASSTCCCVCCQCESLRAVTQVETAGAAAAQWRCCSLDGVVCVGMISSRCVWCVLGVQ
jgi:hypothetical protein